MKHASQTQFGRPKEAVRTENLQGPDKWFLLDKLTSAAEHYDLSHRTLGVLKALLSFLPTRDIPIGPAAVVFPSNRRLSERLSGMPISTLRRHLAHLVRAGIVSRQDSPNGKRYARQVRGRIALAFGFDLTPFARLNTELEAQSAKALERAEELELLRAEVMALRSRLLAAEGPELLANNTAMLLRRKPERVSLETAKSQLTDALLTLGKTVQIPEEMSISNTQNERHIQTSDKSYLDSEESMSKPSAKPITEKRPSFDIADGVQSLTAYQAFYPERLRGTDDLIRVSEQIAPMLGIDQPVLHQAKRIMGAEKAAIVVLCILERMDKIKSPGAYLRHLSKVAQKGMLSVAHMLNALNPA